MQMYKNITNASNGYNQIKASGGFQPVKVNSQLVSVGVGVIMWVRLPPTTCLPYLCKKFCVCEYIRVFNNTARYHKI